MITLTPYLLLLLAAIVVVIISTKLRVPYTLALVVFGVALGVFAAYTNRQDIYQGANSLLTPNLFFYILLPPIIFEAALHVNYRALRSRAPLILFLIFFGVIFTAFFAGVLVSELLGISLGIALLMSSILSPTDPIAVIDLLHRLKVPTELSTIVESESLLNDATGVILFLVILQYLAVGTISPIRSILDFVWLAGAGVAVGGLVAVGVYLLHRRLNDPAVETALSVAVAYGSYLLAQDIGASGIAATAIAGIAIGTWVAPRTMAPEARSVLATFWKVVVYISTSIIFLAMGLIFAFQDIIGNLRLILVLLGALFVGRALFVYAHRPLAGFLRGKRAQLPKSWYAVLSLAGIRGAIPVALAFSLLTTQTTSALSSSSIHTIIAVVLGVAILSVIIGNIASEWYVRRHFQQHAAPPAA